MFRTQRILIVGVCQLKEQLYLLNKALYEYKVLPQKHLEGEELEKYLREL